MERTGVFHKKRSFSTIIGEFFNRKTEELERGGRNRERLRMSIDGLSYLLHEWVQSAVPLDLSCYLLVPVEHRAVIAATQEFAYLGKWKL